MYYVYLLRGASGRHYIGQTSNLQTRLDQHHRGHTHTTQRLGGNLQLIASRHYSTRQEAVAIERMLKAWKNPEKTKDYLLRAE